jgi:hypothetical protein
VKHPSVKILEAIVKRTCQTARDTLSKLRQNQMYMLKHVRNGDEMAAYFDVPQEITFLM